MSINHKPTIPVSLAQEAYMTARGRRERLIKLTQIGLLVLFIALWEVAAQMKWIDSFLLSSPSRVVATLANLVATGDLFEHLGTTLVETMAGFALGAALGIGLAVVLWWFPVVGRIMDPYLVVINSLPKIALGPVLIVWIGSGMPAIITMAVLVSIVVTLVTVLSGFLEIEGEKTTLLAAFGASRAQVLRMVILPGALPAIISALKLDIGMSWVGVIVGEFLVSRAGLGYLIVYGGQVFKLDLVMASTAVLCVFAALMYFAIAALETAVTKRREDA
jgi:NitT/TauT family transport system permease protein